MSTERPVIILGINAAWQRILNFQELQLGAVQRVQSVQSYASGKGMNVSMALARCGHGKIQLVQACGGTTGRSIVEDLKAWPIEHHPVSISAPTRYCNTLLEDSGRCTELIDPSPMLSDEEWQGVAKTVGDLMAQGPCDVLISGSLPAGNSKPLFDVLGRRPEGADLWVDAVDPKWLELRPAVLKVNAHEILQLAKQAPTSDEQIIAESIQKVAQRLEGTALVVTNEGDAGWAWDGQTLERFKPPRVAKPVNIIGAGDTFFAGLVFAHQHGLSLVKAVDYGARLASRRCEKLTIHELEPCELP